MNGTTMLLTALVFLVKGFGLYTGETSAATKSASNTQANASNAVPENSNADNLRANPDT